MAAQLRRTPPPLPAGPRRLPSAATNPLPSISLPSSIPPSPTVSLRLRSSNPSLSSPLTSPDLPFPGGGGIDIPPPGGKGGGGGSGGSGDDHHHSDEPSDKSGPFDLFLSGWRARVAADPQFPFKVLMEELVGVSACVLGDMASRPNFGLSELDFVFSTLVVGSILNFVLMYLLAPTSLSVSASASAFPSHMFEPGAYSLLARVGTVVYKGVTFAAVGFAAGLVGTAISTGLISLRKRMDPEFETPNKPPPTVLNSVTWALHMGISSNLRYQTINGMEYAMERVLPAAGFKASVVVLRCLNNVLGGMSFVLLARMTGSQKAAVEGEKGEEERLVTYGVQVTDVPANDKDDKEL